VAIGLLPLQVDRVVERAPAALCRGIGDRLRIAVGIFLPTAAGVGLNRFAALRGLLSRLGDKKSVTRVGFGDFVLVRHDEDLQGTKTTREVLAPR
jgi:hypothetical protein